MTLERAAMVTQRNSLLGAPFSVIKKHFENANNIPSGLDYKGKALKKVMQWDAIAYLIANVANAMEGTVFGGFITSHLSGFLTSDIDLLWDSTSQLLSFKQSILHFICMVFELDQTMLDMTVVEESGYAHKHMISIRFATDFTFKIKVDMTLRKKSTKGLFVPITYGRNLAYNYVDGFHNKMTRYELPKKIPINLIMDKLQQGKDIWLIVPKMTTFLTNPQKETYNLYVKERTEKVIGYGFEMGPVPLV